MIPGGIIVFDDYFTVGEDEDIGVRQAVDELVKSGMVGPLRKGSGAHVWTERRGEG